MTNDISKAATEFGRMGGKAVAKKYGRAHFQALAKLSAEKRRNKKKAVDNTEETAQT